MSAPVLLLSDLHLPDEPSVLRQRFLNFLNGPARSAEAIYLLGDLFEVWIGDAEGLIAYAPEAAALRALRGAGITTYFMHGNRDFLVGSSFAEAAGLVLLPDPLVVDLAGTPTLLSHGDLWCTDDLAYQRWRRFSRMHWAQAVFRPLPRSLRQTIAGAARGRSDRDKQAKSVTIMDVNQHAIDRAFAEHGVRRIVHGHTHRPAKHLSALNGIEHERIVLADWRPDRCEYLAVDADGLNRVLLPVG